MIITSIKKELIKTRDKFKLINIDNKLKGIIDNTFENINDWKVSQNKDIFEIIPSVPELMGYTSLEVNDLNVEHQKFVSLKSSSKDNLYSWGFKDNCILLSIPPMSEKFYNNISLYQYENEFIDKLNIGNIKGIQLDRLGKESLRLNSLTRNINLSDGKTLVIIVNSYFDYTVFIYTFENLNRIKEVDRIEFDSDFNVTFNNKYTLNYDRNVVISIKDSNGVESYSKNDLINESKSLHSEVFSRFNASTIEKINEYLIKNNTNSPDMQRLFYNELKNIDFDILEEILESIYTLYSLPENMMILEFLKKQYNLNIQSVDTLHAILVIIQNVVQDLIDEI